jgi:DNA-binding NtrC family response regulator
MGTNSPTIMIVEDEALLLLHVSEIAKGAGFTTVLASSAEEALSKLPEHEIRILMTDVNLPGPMNGLELAQIVRNTRPDVQIVIASGHTPSMEFADAVFLAKPFTSNQLVAVLVGIL